MAKNDDKKLEKRLWDGVHEEDFDIDRNVEDVDIAEYDKKNMTLFASNINLFRQIIRLSDSLKPVERRILQIPPSYVSGTFTLPVFDAQLNILFDNNVPETFPVDAST